MKYIRTKDGIYSYEPTHDIDVDGFVVQHNLTGWDKPIMKEDIIKITDTIEELCDVIVCRNELFYPLTSNREGNEFDLEEIDRFRKTIIMSEEGYNKIKETSNDFEPYFWKAYGAIWTDKGLIYVAKMNGKGELELL